METFFTADTHFGHKNIIKYCNRPFGSVEEMDEEMIRRWNMVVKPGDKVWHLGDFSYCCHNAREIRKRLNGRILLIKGNHDSMDALWGVDMEVIYPYHETKINEQEIVLFHYGLRTWHHDVRGTWHLYGHSHGGLAPYGKSMDVGVDVHNFAPIHYSFVEKFMAERPIGDHPQFKNFTGSK